jgi:hypothetical protein
MKTLKRLTLLVFVFLLTAFCKKEKLDTNHCFSHHGVPSSNDSSRLRGNTFVTGTNDNPLIQQIDLKLVLPLRDESWWLVR